MTAKLTREEDHYETVWEIVQEPENRQIVEALSGEDQLPKDEVLERVNLDESELYDTAEDLEEAGLLDHYQQRHGRQDQTVELSLFHTFYSAEAALEFDNQEEYVTHMLKQDEELLADYRGED